MLSKLTIIGSDNDLSPSRRQAIIWTNTGILLIGRLGTIFSEILIEIRTFSFKKMHLKILSGKWRPFCPGLTVLRSGHCNSLENRLTIDFVYRHLILKWVAVTGYQDGSYRNGRKRTCPIYKWPQENMSYLQMAARGHVPFTNGHKRTCSIYKWLQEDMSHLQMATRGHVPFTNGRKRTCPIYKWPQEDMSHLQMAARGHVPFTNGRKRTCIIYKLFFYRYHFVASVAMPA